jgi:hypothetical protein
MNAAALVERAVAGALIVIHAGLLAWACVGFAELLLPGVPWGRVSNPLFSTAMLATQWTLIALSSVTYLAGFFWRWSHTPSAMAVLYAAMALVCAYQTFFILTSPTRFRAMAIEYAEYAVILAFLFFSPFMRARFAQGTCAG